MKQFIFFVALIIIVFSCDTDVVTSKKIEKQQVNQIVDSDSIYKVKGKRILDSITPMTDFKLKSGGYLTPKEASIIYYADTTNLEHLLDFCMSLYREGYFNQAYYFLNDLVKKDSSYKSEVYFQKAQLWDYVPNNDSSLFYLNKTIELSPTTAMFYFYRARAYEKLNLYQKSIDDLNKAIKLTPKNKMLVVNRGYVKAQLGDNKGALEDLQEIIPQVKNDPEFYLYRAIVCFKLNGFEDCIKQCNISIELNPTIGRCYTLRGGAYISIGENEKGLADYKKAAELGDPEGIKAYNGSLEYLRTHKKI